MKRFLMLLTLSWFFMACEKEKISTIVQPPPPEVEEMSLLEKVWSTNIDSTGRTFGSEYIHTYKDWVITFGDDRSPFSVYAHDKITGKEAWKFEFADSPTSAVRSSIIEDNFLIALTPKEVIKFDLDKQQIVWLENFHAAGGNCITPPVKYKDLIYTEMGYYIGQYFESYKFSTFEWSSGKRSFNHTVFSDTLVKRYISPPLIHDDVLTGRTLIIYKSYIDTIDYDPINYVQYLEARDLINRTLVWRTKLTDTFGGDLNTAPVISGNIIITGSDWSINGVDINTGKLLWKTPVPTPNLISIWTFTNHLIHGDHVYVKSGGDGTTCININTGNIVWHNPNTRQNATKDMLFHKGMLIYTSLSSGSVLFIDAQNGSIIEELNKYVGNSKQEKFRTNIIHDKDSDMFYVKSNRNVVAFKLKK